MQEVSNVVFFVIVASPIICVAAVLVVLFRPDHAKIKAMERKIILLENEVADLTMRLQITQTQLDNSERERHEFAPKLARQ